MLLAVEDPYTAYCLDEAVGYFGSYVEARMDEVKAKNEKTKAAKRDNVLRKYTGQKMKYRDIMDLVKDKKD
jgi:hypothetical protein